MRAGQRLVRIELFGIPRARAGVAQWHVEFDDETVTLGHVLAVLGAAFPALANECICDGALRAGFSANLGGNRFVSDPREIMRAGESLLILSADAGG